MYRDFWIEDSKMLRKSMLDVTQRATQSQALKKITAGYELLPASDHGIRYILWAADASHSKPKPAETKPKAFRDPFASRSYTARTTSCSTSSTSWMSTRCCLPSTSRRRSSRWTPPTSEPCGRP